MSNIVSETAFIRRNVFTTLSEISKDCHYKWLLSCQIMSRKHCVRIYCSFLIQHDFFPTLLILRGESKPDWHTYHKKIKTSKPEPGLEMRFKSKSNLKCDSYCFCCDLISCAKVYRRDGFKPIVVSFCASFSKLRVYSLWFRNCFSKRGHG